MKVLFSIIIPAFLVLEISVVAKEVSPPNIILIMADDLGAESVGCYGSTSYLTPNLDAMAASGIRFNNAYATPLCTPTRAMIMSGLYPQVTGHRGLIGKAPEVRMSPQVKTFGHYLRDAGYATAIAGKWQLGQFDVYPDHPVEMGFDQYSLWKWVFEGTKTQRYWKPGIWENGKSVDGDEEVYGPDRYSSFLMNFIQEKKNKPFFIYFPMALTHSPFVDPPARALDSKQNPDLELKKQQPFAKMITYADEIVGNINALLEELEIADKTLVIFTADNGTDRNIKGSRIGDLVIPGGKGSMTEAGARVPFIAKWPAAAIDGYVSEQFISLVDLVPTFNALSGIKTEEKVNGLNLSHYFTGEDGEDRDHIFVCYREDCFVRTDKWRLHDSGELYYIPVTSNEERYGEKKKESEKYRAKLQVILDSYEMEQYAVEPKAKENKQ